VKVEIPDKLYFKIGEVAELTGVKPHVLRYWESEFGPFRPAKSRSRQRLYRQKDIELVLRLKDLLYNQGFTIAGAKKKLREPEIAAAAGAGQLDLPLEKTAERRLLDEVRGDLLRLRALLDRSH
jgi:DNA-binding transcriptional MerR regulator